MESPLVITAAVTGHRPPKLGLSYRGKNEVDGRVRSAILNRLRDQNVGVLISGMALGIDMLAAEAALQEGVPFIAAVPFEGQEGRWPEESQRRYQHLLRQAWDITVVSAKYDAGAFQRRNEWMVDHSQMLFAFWDGSAGGTANCVEYAQRVAKNRDYAIDYFSRKGN